MAVLDFADFSGPSAIELRLVVDPVSAGTIRIRLRANPPAGNAFTYFNLFTSGADAARYSITIGGVSYASNAVWTFDWRSPNQTTIYTMFDQTLSFTTANVAISGSANGGVTGLGSASVSATAATGYVSVPPPSSFTNIPYVSGTVGVSYNDNVQSVGATNITRSGTLPGGLTGAFSTSAGGSGNPGYVVTGTPTTAGTSSFTLTASNSGGSTTYNASITINDPLPPAPNRPTSLTATSDRTDGVELVYSGASGTITNYGIFWSTSQTATPTSALFTDTASPYLDTTMSQGATRYYWIRAQGPGGNSAWFPTTNGIAGFRAFPTPSFTDTTLATSLKLYKSYSDQVTATNAVSYSVFTTGAPAGTIGSLPPGLSLNTSTGAITGTPTTQGVYSFRIEASPGVGGPVAYSPSSTTWHTLTVGPNGTRVNNSLGITPLTTAKRFDETTGWTNISIMRRFDGTAWQNILNE